MYSYPWSTSTFAKDLAATQRTSVATPTSSLNFLGIRQHGGVYAPRSMSQPRPTKICPRMNPLHCDPEVLPKDSTDSTTPPWQLRFAPSDSDCWCFKPFRIWRAQDSVHLTKKLVVEMFPCVAYLSCWSPEKTCRKKKEKTAPPGFQASLPKVWPENGIPV